jgi:hypothetical protein
MSRSLRFRSAGLLPVGNLQPVLPGRRRSGLMGGPLQIVYGNDRKNIFRGSSISQAPVVFVGGDKGDVYKITPGLLSVVADLASAPEPGDDDKPDTLDLTAIDRASALVGYLRIGADVLMTDVVSGMATLLHDPFGVASAGNAIERVKVQYRDPVTGVVDASRSQYISMADWLGGGPGTVGGILDLGPLLKDAAPQGAVVDGVIQGYDVYNAMLAKFKDYGTNLPGVLEQILPDAYDPAAPLLAGLIASLPLTGQLGLPSDAAVQKAWADATKNLDLIG